MKYFILILLSIGFLGCSGEQMSHSITKTQITMSGNKLPESFEFANLETMRDYVFDTKDFTFSLPGATEKDYTVMGGWIGESMHDGKTIAIGLRKTIAYQIVLTASSVFDYTEADSKLEQKNENYFKYEYPQKTRKNGEVDHIDTHIEYHGKENYSCIVSKSKYLKRGKYKKFFSCYKFNPSKTKSKSVTVSLTYNQTQSKQYTYQDLQNRAKRTLDSLYIKDGW